MRKVKRDIWYLLKIYKILAFLSSRRSYVFRKTDHEEFCYISVSPEFRWGKILFSLVAAICYKYLKVYYLAKMTYKSINKSNKENLFGSVSVFITFSCLTWYGVSVHSSLCLSSFKNIMNKKQNFTVLFYGQSSTTSRMFSYLTSTTTRRQFIFNHNGD